MLQHGRLEQGEAGQSLAGMGGMEVLNRHLERQRLLRLDLGNLIETRSAGAASTSVGEGVCGGGVGVAMVVVVVVVGGGGGGDVREVVLLLLVGGLVVLGGG